MNRQKRLKNVLNVNNSKVNSLVSNFELCVKKAVFYKKLKRMRFPVNAYGPSNNK